MYLLRFNYRSVNTTLNLLTGTMLETYSNVRILRVYGTIIEDMTAPGLSAIPLLARRRIQLENDEDSTKVPKILQQHSLHFKIRERSSTTYEIREFIRCEDELIRNYEQFHEIIISDEYITLKKKAENVVIKEAQVIFYTCAEAGSNRMKTREVKQCIIDECAMCIEPETLLPMILSKKIILVGDHKQLQPVVLSKTAESLGLKVSMFQRLFRDRSMSQYRIMLTEQYRMVSL